MKSHSGYATLLPGPLGGMEDLNPQSKAVCNRHWIGYDKLKCSCYTRSRYPAVNMVRDVTGCLRSSCRSRTHINHGITKPCLIASCISPSSMGPRMTAYLKSD
ncbi:hypothetical protein NDU88_010628 [Pleurodeles waltl]|uniref:Uncharacterized protein n=1 Tax=Pleurodeles waltl TaxID=8319 RepID=A0AAV7R0V5_PLEWA|nr:hypothetical protein NDU88_010628 [Pleurodeles waltl]